MDWDRSRLDPPWIATAPSHERVGAIAATVCRRRGQSA